MKKNIKFYKSITDEGALFFFSIFGVVLTAFAFLGGNLHFLDEGIAIWLIIAGSIVSAVGMVGVFAKNDFFFYDINETK